MGAFSPSSSHQTYPASLEAAYKVYWIVLWIRTDPVSFRWVRIRNKSLRRRIRMKKRPQSFKKFNVHRIFALKSENWSLLSDFLSGNFGFQIVCKHFITNFNYFGHKNGRAYTGFLSNVPHAHNAVLPCPSRGSVTRSSLLVFIINHLPPSPWFILW